MAFMPFHHLPPLLAGALAARGYDPPTPVQAAVLEPEAEGRDLIVSAPRADKWRAVEPAIEGVWPLVAEADARARAFLAGFAT